MAPTRRVSLARGAYQAALRAARARSTPHTWARLVRAAWNLREASREAEGRELTPVHRP